MTERPKVETLTNEGSDNSSSAQAKINYSYGFYSTGSGDLADLEEASVYGSREADAVGESDKEPTQASDKNEAATDNMGNVYLKGFALYASVVSLILSLFLAALDLMIVSTLIEDVARQFGDYSKTGWIFTGYSLPNSLLCLLWGRIAAVIGFKSSMLTSIIIFEVGSLIAGAANSMNMLIGGRVISGLGGSGIQSLVFVIGLSLVEERKKGILIACLSSAFGLASVAGPFLGGAFTSHVTWRWCFYINLPIGGVAFFTLVLFYNPCGHRQSIVQIAKQFCADTWRNLKGLKRLCSVASWKFIWHCLIYQFDIIEFLLCTCGLLLVLLGFSFGGNKYKWNSANIIALFVIGISLIISALIYDFVVFPRYKTVRDNIKYQPLIKWKNFRKPGIFTANCAAFFANAAAATLMVYVVQFFQLVYNDTAWNAAIHLLAIVIPTVVAVIASGIFNSKTGYIKPACIFGGVTIFVGAGLLTMLDNTSTNSQHIGFLILPGLGFGAILQTSLLGCQSQVDQTTSTARMDFISVVTLNNFLKILGQAFGGVLCEAVFSASILNKLKQHNITLNPGQENTADELIIYRGKYFDGATSLMGDLISDSIKNVFYMALGFSAITFIASVFTSNKKNHHVNPTTSTSVSATEKNESTTPGTPNMH